MSGSVTIFLTLIIMLLLGTYGGSAYENDAYKNDAYDEMLEQMLQNGQKTMMSKLNRVKNASSTRKRTYEEYSASLISEVRVNEGRTLLELYWDPLVKISNSHGGIPPSIAIAIWGIESNYGAYMGRYNLIDALLSMAMMHPKKAAWHMKNLSDITHILGLVYKQKGHIPTRMLRGSFGGAMGQIQFLPRSYKRFAIDASKKGYADIWSDERDIFRSIFNYLNMGNGWKKGYWQKDVPWGIKVRMDTADMSKINSLPYVHVKEARCLRGSRDLKNMSAFRPASYWHGIGVKRAWGGDIVVQDKLLKMARVRGGIRNDTLLSLVVKGSSSVLVTKNYLHILSYNCTHSYGLTVGFLSDELYM